MSDIPNTQASEQGEFFRRAVAALRSIDFALQMIERSGEAIPATCRYDFILHVLVKAFGGGAYWIIARLYHEHYRKTCMYCGRRLDDIQYLDHVKPRSLGGTDHWANLVPCCPSCNSRKGTRDLVAFRELSRYRGIPLRAKHFDFLDSRGVHVRDKVLAKPQTFFFESTDPWSSEGFREWNEEHYVDLLKLLERMTFPPDTSREAA